MLAHLLLRLTYIRPSSTSVASAKTSGRRSMKPRNRTSRIEPRRRKQAETKNLQCERVSPITRDACRSGFKDFDANVGLAWRSRRYHTDALVHGNVSVPDTHSPIHQRPSLCLLNATGARIYRCIGAKLSILLHFLSLSSLPTTLFIREPMGSPPLLMSTQALSSNLTTLPSGLWYFFFVRTTTACLMSPLRTLFAAETDTAPPDSGPKFRCFCTTTIMRSPIRNQLGLLSSVPSS